MKEEKIPNSIKLSEVCEICGKSKTKGSLTSWIFSTRSSGCKCKKTSKSNRSNRSNSQIESISNDSLDANNQVKKRKATEPGEFLSRRYKIGDLLGIGGMGTVYKAYDSNLKREFAVKILQADLAEDPLALKRFEQEANAASKLTHPNIIAVYDHGVEPAGSPYIIMDYIEGKGLDDILESQVYVEWQNAIDVFVKVADALEHAHNKGIIHRDLKPSNIMISGMDSESTDIKIVDFGIAKLIPEGDLTTQGLTQTGELIGSPSYMSPEQCTGMQMDRRSDVYSIGCVMYEVLTGSVPFRSENPIQTILKHINDEPEKLQQKASSLEIPDELNYIVMRCLEKNPDDRYQTCLELLEDLKSLDSGKRIARVKPKGKSSKKKVAGIASVATVGALILAMLIMNPGSVLNYSLNGKNQSGNLSTKEAWINLNSKGQRYFDHGAYDKAKEILSKALVLAKNEDKVVLKKASLRQLRDLAFTNGDQLTTVTYTNKLDKLDEEQLHALNVLITEIDENSTSDSSRDKSYFDELANRSIDQIEVQAESVKLEVAVNLIDKLIKKIESTLGKEHKTYSRAVHSKAYIYYAKGYYKEAIIIYERVLKLEKKLNGAESIATAKAMTSLASAKIASGFFRDNPKEIASLLDSSYKIYRDKADGGPKSKQVAEVRLIKALNYFNCHKPNEANRELNASIAIYKSLDNPNNKDLARCYAVKAFITSAPKDFEKALSTAESLTTTEPDSMVNLLVGYGNTLANTDSKYASSLIKRAIAITDGLKASQKYTLQFKCFIALGRVKRIENNFEESLENFKNALSTSQQYGLSNSEQLEALSLIAAAYQDKGDLATARTYFDKYFGLKEKSNQPNNSIYTTARSRYAALVAELNK